MKSWLVAILFMIAWAPASGADSPGAALASLKQLMLTNGATPDEARSVLEGGLELLVGASRAERCREQFIAGEMHRLAALAGAGAVHEAAALDRFRAMRVEFIDLLESALGYIGESRVLRQQKRLVPALEILGPLLENDVDPRLRRLAELEEMEALLILDVNDALARATAVGAGAEWVAARAHARLHEHDEALRVARHERVRATVGVYDRLAFIDDLGGLTDEERAEWAQLLAALRHTDRALAVLRDSCPPAAWSLFAGLLEVSGDDAAAAEVWLRGADEEPGHRLAAALCLERAGDRDAAVGQYRAVVSSTAGDEDRRTALRRYAGLVGHDAARPLLEAHASLIGDDPYLIYSEVAAQRGDGNVVEPLQQLESIDRDGVDAPLRAASVLLRAQLEPDQRRSLALLTERWALLSAHENTRDGADRLRTQCWVDLGMIDAAAEAIARDPEGHSSAVLLRVSGALADRNADVFGDETAQRVVRLAALAIEQALTDESVAFEAAMIMRRVGAMADAERVLVSLGQPRARRARADLLLERGEAATAMTLLDGDESAAADLIRSRCLVALDRPGEAVAPLRAARRKARDGSDTWWVATIALVRAQSALGNADAAESMLRVASALHPVTPQRPFFKDFEQLTKEFD